MVYNIADFLLVQLRLCKIYFNKSAWSSHVCLNYISTVQLSLFKSKFVIVMDKTYFRAGILSVDKNSAAVGYGWGMYYY